MAKKRSRGQKYPNNFIDMAILLFLRDNKQSTTEIKKHLEESFGITTGKNIQNHLQKLSSRYLHKVGKSGMPTFFEWKKTSESFKNIINFMNENLDIIKNIIENHSILLDNLKDDEVILHKFIQSNISGFNPTKYWYNTKYVKSFLNEKTIEYFAYDAYSRINKLQFKDRLKFEKIVFGGLDRKTLVVFMHYSPSLILYLVNLSSRLLPSDQTQSEKLIITMLLNDIWIHHYQSHEGMSSSQFGIHKLIKNSKFNAVELKIQTTIHNPEALKIANS